MPSLSHQPLGNGIFQIDTALYRPGHTACYLIEDGGELAVLDTGTSNNIPPLLELLRGLGFGPEAVRYVMPTHVHLDHAGGAGALLATCPNASLVIHHKGASHMIDPAKLQAGAMTVYGEDAFRRDYGELTPAPAERVVAAHDGDRFMLGSREILFADTPGHANHHGCFFDVRTATWFTGDTFGLCYREFDAQGRPLVIATTTPVAFDPQAWMASLDKLMAAQPTAVCLTHFGRLPATQALVAQLREDIQAHAALALAEEMQDEAGWDERLQQAVAAHLIDRARRHKPDMDGEQARKLLAHDIALNAQGLAVWLKRRAKARDT